MIPFFQVSLKTLSKKETNISFMLPCDTYFITLIKVLLLQKHTEKILRDFFRLESLTMNRLKSKFPYLPRSGTILNVIGRSTYKKKKYITCNKVLKIWIKSSSLLQILLKICSSGGKGCILKNKFLIIFYMNSKIQKFTEWFKYIKIRIMILYSLYST